MAVTLTLDQLRYVHNRAGAAASATHAGLTQQLRAQGKRDPLCAVAAQLADVYYQQRTSGTDKGGK